MQERNSIALIWNRENKPLLAIWKKDYSFNDLVKEAQTVFKTKGSSNRKICVLIENVTLEITEGNYPALFQLNPPVIIQYDYDDIDEDDGDDDDDDDDDDAHSNSVAKVDLYATVHVADLSVMNATVTQGGSRWTELEETYLKNLFKYLSKKNQKLEIDTFSAWLKRRNTTKDHLFGSRTHSAIITHYKQMNARGDFNNIWRFSNF